MYLKHIIRGEIDMKKTMNYKGYTGSVEFSKADGLFYGKVQGIRSLISYEASGPTILSSSPPIMRVGHLILSISS